MTASRDVEHHWSTFIHYSRRPRNMRHERRSRGLGHALPGQTQRSERAVPARMTSEYRAVGLRQDGIPTCGAGFREGALGRPRLTPRNQRQTTAAIARTTVALPRYPSW
jgi:hypothetical protein